MFLFIEHLFINIGGLFALFFVYYYTYHFNYFSSFSRRKFENFFTYIADTVCLVQFCSNDFSGNFNPVTRFKNFFEVSFCFCVCFYLILFLSQCSLFSFHCEVSSSEAQGLQTRCWHRLPTARLVVTCVLVKTTLSTARNPSSISDASETFI